MEFSRQEYWSELSFPTTGDLPDPGITPTSLTSPALAGRFFTTSTTWEAHGVSPKWPHGQTVCWKDSQNSQKMVILTAVVYYRKRTQMEISQGKRCTGLNPGQFQAWSVQMSSSCRTGSPGFYWSSIMWAWLTTHMTDLSPAPSRVGLTPHDPEPRPTSPGCCGSKPMPEITQPLLSTWPRAPGKQFTPIRHVSE